MELNMVKKSYLFLADGFEEIEALATVDMLRRAGMDVVTVSINPDNIVNGAHGVPVVADMLIADFDADDADWLILPGGLPGAVNLVECGRLVKILKTHKAKGGRFAAICASPAFVLGALGLLEGIKATCYPGCESKAPGIEFTGNGVEVTPRVITGKGPGYTPAFSLAIIEATFGRDAAASVASEMLLGGA